MFGKRGVIGILLLSVLAGAAAGQGTARSYVESGREFLFQGTLSGIYAGAEILEEGYNDTTCADCRDDRELLLFYALSRITLWCVKEDGGAVDSGFELAAAAGAPVEGDILREITMTEPEIAEDRYGRPALPDTMEGLLAALSRFADETAVPEMEAVIALLDRITETPSDPFKVYITPLEMQGLFGSDVPPYTYAIEVDYGDVLLLKGTLSMIKAYLTMQRVYDVQVSQGALLKEKIHEGMFSIQNDLLLPHPDFLTLLPTANDPADGTAHLAAVRRDVTGGLGYYLDAVDYLLAESYAAGDGDLDHELLAIDPTECYLAERIREQVDAMHASLAEDTPFAVERETRKTYYLENSQDFWIELQMVVSPYGFFEGGEIRIGDNYVLLTFPEVEFELVGNRLYAYAYDGWSWNPADGPYWGYFTGLMNEDRTRITEAEFEYWGRGQGRITNLSGWLRLWSQKFPFIVDLNPIFGGSERYPDPVSPRDLLCEFSDWNKPLEGSLVRGLDGDPTLGGILPETTELQLNAWVDPQPAGRLEWPLLAPWQMVAGRPAFWLDEQLVFTDRTGDVAESAAHYPGLDIGSLYMGFGWTDLYGCLVLNDSPFITGYKNYRVYTIYLSGSPVSHEAEGAVKIEILASGNDYSGKCYVRNSSAGNPLWFYIGPISVWGEGNRVNFRLPLYYSIPVSLSGRYLSVDSSTSGYAADINHTGIQIGRTGSLSGEVVFDGYRGGPVFVRAFTDWAAPKSSVVAYTVLDGPGAFALGGIGLGQDVYLEAFCPLFGDYHPLDMDALKISTVKAVPMRSESIQGILLTLETPRVLTWNLWNYGELFDPSNIDDYFAFDAIAGATYVLAMNRPSNSPIGMTLLDRNGNGVLTNQAYWQTQRIDWKCPIDGRYYVRVFTPQVGYGGGVYQIKMASNLTCPLADISGDQWPGVRDCVVDLYDFAMLAGHWIQGCAEPYWCDDGDYDRSGRVDTWDLAEMADAWLSKGAWGAIPEGCESAEMVFLYQIYCGSTVGTSNREAWFVFTPSFSRYHTISLCGSSYDTWLDVYDECNGYRRASNDDYCGAGSQVRIYLTAGEDYYLRVGGYGTSVGNYKLYISL